MPVELLPLCADDMAEMAAIFNHYVEHSFATYTETPVSVERFGSLMSFSPGYPAFVARDSDGSMAGFGLLRPYSLIPAFDRAAELTCFLSKGNTGRGIGSAILQVLESGAAELGIETIVATVSSLNEESLRFHRARGFVEQGRLVGIGSRNGRKFDVVYLQKIL
ncbi:GNAT family N-acetyltransferase [Chlorobaculum sp. MV4-Y]|uniref:GNAT family N-acetyltransferase n=1 Tax=Chlorobaculum sp. MV4-Y TaxID=2976335 RepID=UPI0021AFDFB8|nr:GNAT family N-acetyltransferase [Chlorobaculum sp. MV4-Y]UWX58361.1 GNAT family N-acetyltransferase [Chlorobaculum sp. MV4-Y]